MRAEVLANVYEHLSDIHDALENMNYWKPLYESLLKVCKTKEEALDALQFLIDIKEDL